MDGGIHFISGLPRSGSTLLAAIFRQNPRLHHSGMSSPIAHLFGQLMVAMAARNEWSVLVGEEQRQSILRALFDGYYRAVQTEKMVVDTNRAWCSRMPALARLFPESRVIACVRDFAWIIDSFERVVRKNPFLLSRMFTPEQSATVYTRVDFIASPAGPAGFAWNALQDAFYGEHANRLIVVDYEALTTEPQRTMEALYDALGLPRFTHDFDNVFNDGGDEFDVHLGAPGLHSVSSKVRFVERSTILPPDIFHRFSNRCFWRKQQPHSQRIPILLPSEYGQRKSA